MLFKRTIDPCRPVYALRESETTQADISHNKKGRVLKTIRNSISMLCYHKKTTELFSVKINGYVTN